MNTVYPNIPRKRQGRWWVRFGTIRLILLSVSHVPSPPLSIPYSTNEDEHRMAVHPYSRFESWFSSSIITSVRCDHRSSHCSASCLRPCTLTVNAGMETCWRQGKRVVSGGVLQALLSRGIRRRTRIRRVQLVSARWLL